MIRFDFIPYPLWRRRVPSFAKSLWLNVTSAFTFADDDWFPPTTPARMADFLTRGGLLPRQMDARAAMEALESYAAPPVVTAPSLTSPPAPLSIAWRGGVTQPKAPPSLRSGEGGRGGEVKNTPIRLPAQWEPLEAVIVAFPIYYPPLWATHAAMIAAIADAGARVDVLVPSEGWAKIAAFALEHTFEVKGAHDPTRVRWIVLPTDDIWVRDYAPFIGFRPDGTRAALGMIYDPLSTYSQWRDDSMQKSYAELNAIPFQKVQFRTEGGNFWSDGAGTLIVSDDLYDRNPKLAPAAVENALHRSFAFETLIVTPKLWREETGHVDLLLKLADAGTVLVSAPTIIPNGGRLARAAAILRGARNAAGERYRVLELPTPPPYLNWGVYPIWRSYTNALTVNGRVLVPTFGIDMDARALAIYRAAMPEYEIIPISCAAAANGGGGVHCLTHEVPALPLRHE